MKHSNPPGFWFLVKGLDKSFRFSVFGDVPGFELLTQDLGIGVSFPLFVGGHCSN